MAIYYLSNNGNDNNNGLSPESPFKTIGKLNEIICGGDTARFKCGDTFYGRILPPDSNTSATPTTYESYGDGAKPIVSQYKKANKGAWDSVANNVWRLDLKDVTKFTGNVLNLDTNVGFIKASGVIHAVNAFSLDGLQKDWDFYSDDQYLYVKLSICPDEASDEILIACNIHHVCFQDNIKVDSITFCGGGAHGIAGVVHGAHILNCEFHEIGGSILPGYPTKNTRYGNGVECWTDSSDVLVENCKFSNIYDVAMTMQGRPAEKGWINITFRNNVVWNCQQAFEIWSGGNEPDTGFKNCVFENNICLHSGYSWSYDVRPNTEVSSHLLIYGLECPVCDVKVRNNTFYNARTFQIYKSGGMTKLPYDYVMENNTFITTPEKQFANAGMDNDEYQRRILTNNSVITTYDPFTMKYE